MMAAYADSQPQDDLWFCEACRAVFLSDPGSCPNDGRDLHRRAEDPWVGGMVGLYRIDRVLGTGATGRFYRAHHTSLERSRILKLGYGELSTQSSINEKLVAGTLALSTIRHNHVIAVEEIGRSPEGLPYTAFEAVEGEPLDQLLAREGALHPGRVISIAKGIASSLAAIHELGFTHRQLRPSSVLVGPDGTKLLDFGMVGLPPGEGGSIGHSVEGSAYLSPEQGQGLTVGPMSDLYTLGVLIYQMAAGKLPFSGGSTMELLTKHIGEAPPTLPVAGGLEKVVAALLLKDPQDRPSKADVLVRMLGELSRMEWPKPLEKVEPKLQEVKPKLQEVKPKLREVKPKPQTVEPELQKGEPKPQEDKRRPVGSAFPALPEPPGHRMVPASAWTQSAQEGAREMTTKDELRPQVVEAPHVWTGTVAPKSDALEEPALPLMSRVAIYRRGPRSTATGMAARTEVTPMVFPVTDDEVLPPELTSVGFPEAVPVASPEVEESVAPLAPPPPLPDEERTLRAASVPDHVVPSTSLLPRRASTARRQLFAPPPVPDLWSKAPEAVSSGPAAIRSPEPPPSASPELPVPQSSPRRAVSAIQEVRWGPWTFRFLRAEAELRKDQFRRLGPIALGVSLISGLGWLIASVLT